MLCAPGFRGTMYVPGYGGWCELRVSRVRCMFRVTGDVVCSGFPGYDVCSGLQGMLFVPGLRGLDNRGLSYIVCLEFLIRIVKARVLLHVF